LYTEDEKKYKIANKSLIPKTLSGFVYQDLVVGWSGAWCASGCRKRQKPEMIRKAHIDRFRPKAAIKKPNQFTSYRILLKRSSLLSLKTQIKWQVIGF
jgi:hypothetical protein